MIAIIKCQTCNEVMGQIDKPIISQEDIDMYQSSLICSQGHSSIQIGEPDEE